jgi:hypothetical protein
MSGESREKEGVIMLILSSVILIVVGISFISIGLWIHPNVIDTIVNGSLGFSLIGALFMLMGLACAIKAIRDSIIERNLKNRGTDNCGYITQISPIFKPKGSKKKLIGYHVDILLYKGEDGFLEKQYVYAPTPIEVKNGFVLVRSYKNHHRFIENITENDIPKTVLEKFKKEI